MGTEGRRGGGGERRRERHRTLGMEGELCSSCAGSQECKAQDHSVFSGSGGGIKQHGGGRGWSPVDSGHLEGTKFCFEFSRHEKGPGELSSGQGTFAERPGEV